MSQHAPGNSALSEDTLGGRLPLLKPQVLDDDQRKLYDYLQETKISWASQSHFQSALEDGRLIGPFNIFLYSPQISQAFNGWVDAEAEHTSLSPTVRQIIILTVGAAWNSAYEQYAHTAVAHTVGLKDEAVQSIRSGQEPEQLSAEESAAYQLTRTLSAEHGVGDEIYQHSVRTFGEKGVVDMINLAGLYMAVSALLNAFQVPAPG